MRIVLTLLLWVSLSVSASDFDDMKALAEQGYADAQFNLAVSCTTADKGRHRTTKKPSNGTRLRLSRGMQMPSST
jgi:hypothetical protein